METQPNFEKYKATLPDPAKRDLDTLFLLPVKMVIPADFKFQYYCTAPMVIESDDRVCHMADELSKFLDDFANMPAT